MVPLDFRDVILGRWRRVRGVCAPSSWTEDEDEDVLVVELLRPWGGLKDIAVSSILRLWIG
jgi:hypothetical protein